MSFLAHLDNHTPFTAGQLVLMGPDGQEWLLVVVCATFQQFGAGDMAPAAVQSPVRFTDEYFGDPACSSLRYASDIALSKPKVDVVVNASAYAPRARFGNVLEASIRVGALHKSVLVKCEEGAGSTPITYERAFGGTSGGGCCSDNPVGIGFKGAASADPLVRSRQPSIEHSRLGHRQATGPAGFGAIARGWQPRASHAGTYDQAWRDSRWPLLPTDYDARFEQVAPADQQLAALEGGEPVDLTNLTPDGRWSFRMPAVTAPIYLLYPDRAVGVHLRADTVLIEADARRVRVTSRFALRTRRSEPPPSRVVVGHLSRGQARAYRARKKYLGRGLDPSCNYRV